MGKGYLMPDSRTLADCEIPVFKTHPTPINVTIRPQVMGEESHSKRAKGGKEVEAAAMSHLAAATVGPTSQGCGCTIL